MVTVFAATRAPQGILGWRKDSMPPGTWATMRKPDGTFAPEIIVSCPKCYGDIVLTAEQAFGKKSVSHVSRSLFDPRRGRGTKTFRCSTQFIFRRDKECFEIVT